jgi:hypothetical protein
MKTQCALRLEENIVDLARREAERQNRSLANFVEVVLAEALMLAEGARPILSLFDAPEDLVGIEAINDDGSVNGEETARLREMIALGDETRR